MTGERRAGSVVALLGAESTGKTTLARGLAAALAARGVAVETVDEVLREFCVAHGRTPHAAEQAAIAAEQTRRIEQATTRAEVVVADTTALMIAVYSDLVFADTGLYTVALQAQRRCALTLVTALDLPWQADGMQRTGAHVQAPVDELLKRALAAAQAPWQPVAGTGAARLAAALAACDAAGLGRPNPPG